MRIALKFLQFQTLCIFVCHMALAQNPLPVAKISTTSPSEVFFDETVTLDASGSTGTGLTYEWKMLSSISVMGVIEGPPRPFDLEFTSGDDISTEVMPSFIAITGIGLKPGGELLMVGESYVVLIRLTVTDVGGATDEATIPFFVRPLGPKAVIAGIEDDLIAGRFHEVVNEGESVTIDGRLSTNSMRTTTGLSYEWSGRGRAFPAGAALNMSTLTFVVPGGTSSPNTRIQIDLEVSETINGQVVTDRTRCAN